MDDHDGPMGNISSLPYHAIFDILSRTPVKSACRFRCVSKGWRDLICSPVFAAAHKSRHGPLLVDSGSSQKEEPVVGRDLRLMDMDGNVVRVLRGVGGYGMTCNTSLDDLICVDGASCGGVNVVDPATGEVLVTCPRLDVVEHDKFPYVATRYYTTFGFGRALPSNQYKLARLVADNTCEVFTLGDGRGWRRAQPPPIHPRRPLYGPIRILHDVPPVAVGGVMYFLSEERDLNHCSLLCFDLESEQWNAGLLEGPYQVAGVTKWGETTAIRITELNGALCMVQSVCEVIHGRNKQQIDPVTNLWIPDNLGQRNNWIKAYTVPMTPYACRYVPLRVMRDSGKLLLQCSFDEGRKLALQLYDPCNETCTDIMGTPDGLDGRIGLCHFGLDHPAPAKSLLALFLDQAVLFFSKQPAQGIN